MNKEKIKRLIAKEVLIAFGLGIIIALCIGGALLRKEYYKDKRVPVVAELELLDSKIDSLNNINSAYCLETYEHLGRLDSSYHDKVSLGKYGNVVQVEDDAKNIYEWLNENDSAFLQNVTFEKFYALLEKPQKEQINTLKEEKQQKEFELEALNENIWNGRQMEDFIGGICGILLLLIYPARISYFVIRWAIKTLRA
jgi:hypothetical protein